MKKVKAGSLVLIFILLSLAQISFAAEKQNETQVYKLGDIQVSADVSEQKITYTPSKIDINLETYSSPGVAQNITDIIKDSAIVDLRGASDLVPEPDTVYLRGFDSQSYVTAIDGVQFQKSGGYWGFHFIDYSLIPLSMIKNIEIIPGPHSSLYSGQAQGGVINVQTKNPEKHEKTELNGSLATSFKSYETMDTKLNINGGKDNLDIGFALQDYSTDGYLRNNDADIWSVSGRFGYVLPSNGYINVMGSSGEKKTGWIVKNDPAQADYHSNYPIVKETSTTAAQSPTREKEPHYINFKYHQPTSVGTLDLTAYYYYDSQENFAHEKSGRFMGNHSALDVNWQTYGMKIQDEITLFKGNSLILGYDGARLETEWEKMVNVNDLYIQDNWEITDGLRLKLGARYENIDIYWDNWNSTTGYKDQSIEKKQIKKQYNQISPTSFLTCDLDNFAQVLRDTSISVGVSRFWSPRSGYCQV
ncbi:MAG: TonB-dependent receptor plug domain-containing protein [Thermodesulfobacteriota bacterium]|nr:TonB-dependent receptor plug domain-containing protein [Thermodesulfobacteriota bacterium]